MENELISIIVPIYNVLDQYLRKCLNSIIGQSYKNIEILLVDDGSTNNSGKICDEFAVLDSRIKVFHQNNFGVANARNIGIDNSHGNWISFVDSDDWVSSTLIEDLYFETKKHLNVDIVMSNTFIYKNSKIKKNTLFKEFYHIFNVQNKNILQLQILCKTPEYSNLELRTGTVFTKLFNRNFLLNNNIKFKNTLKYMQDNLFCLYAFEYAKKIVYVNKYLYYYRKNNYSVTNTYSPEIIKYFENFFCELDIFIKKFSKEQLFKEYKNVKISNSIFSYMNLYFFNKKNNMSYKKSKKEILELLKNNLYSNSIQKVKYKYLTNKQKIYLWNIKRNYIFIFYLFFLIKRCKNCLRI